MASCAHQGDDNYPVRMGKGPELVSPPVPPPTAPLPTPVPREPQSVPLVTIPAPPAPKSVPIPSKTTPPAPAPQEPVGTVSSRRSSGGGGGSLQLDDPLSAPVKRLISAAEESLKKGRVMEARAQADRAYRMDLRDPRTSFLMARVSEREKAFEDAEQWAMRSLENLSDMGNKKVIWKFIANIREKNGNKKGVADALRKAR